MERVTASQEPNPTKNPKDNYKKVLIDITEDHHQIVYQTNNSMILAWYTSGAFNHNGTYCGEYIIRIKTKGFASDDAYLRFTNEYDFLRCLNSILKNE